MSYNLDRPDPISKQVLSILRKEILNGKYGSDGRLPSEEALAAEFKVSRSTIRNAYALLEAEKLIIRKPGSGTYVNKSILDIYPSFGAYWDYTYLVEASGRIPSIKPLSLSKITADETVAKSLQIELEEPVLRLERVFFADEDPALYSINILPLKIIKNEIDLDATNVDIKEILNHCCQMQIDYVIAEIHAASATKNVASALKIKEGNPLLHLGQIFYGDDSIPMVFTDNYYNDKILRLRISHNVLFATHEEI